MNNVNVVFTTGSFAEVRNNRRGQRNTLFSFRSSYRYNSEVKVDEIRSVADIGRNRDGASTAIAMDSKMEINYRRLQAKYSRYRDDHDVWSEVRARLETRLESHDIDAEAKATFREALDAHEAGLYRCVSRVLFPEFERIFRSTMFDGRAGQIPYNTFVKELSDDAASLKLRDFLIAGIQDLVLFKYLTESVRESDASGRDSRSATSEYVPGFAIGVDGTNIERARRSPIPSRHVVAHGLVVYSSRQSSLNALFIADFVFSVVSQVLHRTPDTDAGDDVDSETGSVGDPSTAANVAS